MEEIIITKPQLILILELFQAKENNLEDLRKENESLRNSYLTLLQSFQTICNLKSITDKDSNLKP